MQDCIWNGINWAAQAALLASLSEDILYWHKRLHNATYQLSGHTSLEPLATFMDQAVAATAGAAGTAEARPTCDICGRHFFNKQTLERHMDRHRPVRQSYECEVCHKTYAFVTGLYHHRKTHGSIARFKCNFCGEHFMYSRSLYKHVSQLHATASSATTQ